MTSRRIALCLTSCLALTASAFAQKPNFKFIPGPKPGGGDVKVTVADRRHDGDAEGRVRRSCRAT